jgi:hypothetical protein
MAQEISPGDGRARTVRGRELEVPGWMTVPPPDRYAIGMAGARAVREGRTRAASRDAVELAGELADRERASAPADAPDPMWGVRGQLRDRGTFGCPHPGDFRGGLPAPREYPR